MVKESWYSISEFCYTRAQVVWLLPYLDLVRDGHWIPEPKVTGYVGGSGKRHIQRASFELPCQIAAELDIRLNKILIDSPTDHHLLLEVYQRGQSSDYLARVMGLGISDVQRRSNRALWYCCGRRQRRISYSDFCAYAGGHRLMRFVGYSGTANQQGVCA